MQEALDFLHSNEGEAEIKNSLRVLQVMGVHSIPTFIVDGRFRVDGAARSEDFVALFRKIEQAGKVEGRSIFSEALGVPQEVMEQGLQV